MNTSWKFMIGKKAYAWLVVGALASIVVAITEYANAAFIQVLLAHIGLVERSKIPASLAEISQQKTLLIVSMFVGITFFKVVAVFFATFAPYVFSNMLNARLRFMTIFEILVSNNPKWLSASEIHTRFGEIYPKAGSFLLQVSNAAVSIIQLLILLCGMFYISWKESVVGLSGLVVVGVVVKLLNRKVLKHANAVPSEQSHIAQRIERISRNWLLVRISGTTRKEYNFLMSRISDYFSSTTHSILFSIMNANFPSFFGVILISIVLVLSQETFNTEGTVLVAFFYLFVRFVQNLGPAVGSVSQALTFLPQYRISKEIVRELRAEDSLGAFAPADNLRVFSSSTQPKLPDLGAVDSGSKKSPSIDISNLNFAWDDREIFSNFNFQIPAGKILGITGESGSGKSTLLQLILGTIHPKSGSIKIDGQNPSEFLAKHSKQIGYVGADPFLFEGSIEDNLKYGLSNEPSSAQIQEALQKARLWDYIQTLDEGLNFKLNENGEGLSSGQRQRLSLARAFLRNPSLLILDEASANLDLKTEEEIETSIHAFKGQATIIIVSHREGILKNADFRIKLPL